MRKKIAKTQTDDELWTPRKLRHMMALGGTGAVPAGTPEMVAEERHLLDTPSSVHNIYKPLRAL